jgi:hypothetical protein
MILDILYFIFVGVVFVLPYLLGLFATYHLIVAARGTDKSNFFNRLRVFWFSLTRQSKMVDKFPWLTKDEWENMNKYDN